MDKISVFIITKNEANRISSAINSVKKIADEIIIVDSNSTDNTVKICENLGAKVIINPWPGYLQQKAFAENLCKNNWILNIDADEELSKDLQDEIEYIFTSDLSNHYTAYKIKITIIHRLDKKVRKKAPFNQVIRLYNKKYWGFIYKGNNSTHDSVTFRNNNIKNSSSISNKTIIKKYLNNKNNLNHTEYQYKNIYELNEPAFHHSGTSIEQLVTKANFYSTEQAEDLINNKVKISNFRIIFEIPLFFCKTFFIRRYYVFGFNGAIDSLILAFARFLRLAKARELQQLRNK